MKKYNIIAVDFDGTLCSGGWPGIGCQKFIHKIVMRFVKKHQKKGTIIILNTLREGVYLEAAIEWCYNKAFFPDYFNENEPEGIDKYYNSRKIGADLYIDDRNIGFIGWLLRLSK